MFFTESKEVLVPRMSSYLILNVVSVSSSLVFPSQLSCVCDSVAGNMRRNNSSKFFNFTEVRVINEPLRNAEQKNDIRLSEGS